MSKPNIWGWRPKTREARTITLTDDVNGEDAEFTFCLWPMTGPEELQALDQANVLIERYIGTETSTEDPLPFAPVGDADVPVTSSGITLACTVCWMQPPFVAPAERWTAEELIAVFARAGKPFRTKLLAFVSEVNGGKKRDPQKAAEAMATNPPGAATN